MKRLFLMVAVFLLMAVSAYGGVWYPQGTVLNYTLGTTYGVAEPFVLYEGNPQILTGVTNIFKMWYTLGNAARGVGYAESLDGKTWIQYGGNPVIANEVRPQIIKIGATYYCYALTDQFTSSDGINWSLAHSAVIPVGGVGTWDHTGIARTVVWIEGATWYCLYEGTDGSKWQTGLATSSDGITWSKDAGNPVLINPKTSSGSASGTWITKQGSTYFLFSHDTPGAGVLPTDIYCYSSTDLHAWTRTSVVAALPRNAVDEGPYIAGQVESANLVEANGFTYLFYGANATDSSKNIIKLAIAYMPLSSVLSTVQGLLPPISGGFDFRDEFKTSLTAGNINGTAAEPGPGNRTVADTNNFLSIANGLIFGASTNAAWDNPQIYYPVLSRVPGKSISWKATSPSGASQWESGLSSTTSGRVTTHSFNVSNTNMSAWLAGNVSPYVGTVTNSTSYSFNIPLRYDGSFFFVKGGTQYPKWKMLYGDNNSELNVYPRFETRDSAYVISYVRNSKNRWLPSPLASDGFSLSFGITDGLGHPEGSYGLGSGGSGLTWQSGSTTWSTTGGTAINTAPANLSQQLALVSLSTPDVLNTVTLSTTPGGSQAGVGLNWDSYSNPQNGILGWTDGTNCGLDKIVGGSLSHPIAATACTFGATLELVVIKDSTSYTLFYGRNKIGATVTISDAGIISNTLHGIFNSGTGAMKKNYIYARGTSNEYGEVVDAMTYPKRIIRVGKSWAAVQMR